MHGLTVRDLLWLGAFGLLARLIAAWPVDYAPYTDPAYYALVAERLASGHGFTVPVIWSFLEVGGRLPTPAELPVPSNAHWMPLTSIVAAGPMALFDPSWRSGQLPSILLSAALVPGTAGVAAWLFRERWIALTSGILAVFAGPLLIYYPTIDNFAMFGALGAGAIAAATQAGSAPGGAGRWLVLSGALCGLATLSRIDGVLLAVAPATAWLTRAEFRRPGGWVTGMATAAAFGVVLLPWLLRNVATFGAPLPSAGGPTLWITSYNEQFSIGHEISLATYLASGPAAIVGSKVSSWLELVGRTAVLLGGTYLLTFIPGLWMARHRRELWPFIAYFIMMFVVMGGVFTFHAPRGAFYHSAPAWLPFAIPLAVASVPAAATAAGRFWPFLKRSQTHRFLVVVATAGAVILSLVGSASIGREWDRVHRLETAASSWLTENGHANDVVMYRDPASLALLSGNPGVAAPFDPFPVIERVIDAYGARWVMVVLDEGASVDPLGLWRGSEGTDAQGNRATFLADEPSFEIDALRIYEVEGP